MVKLKTVILSYNLQTTKSIRVDLNLDFILIAKHGFEQQAF